MVRNALVVSVLLGASVALVGCQNRITDANSRSGCFTDSDCGVGRSCNPFTRKCESVTVPDASTIPEPDAGGGADTDPEPPVEPPPVVCAAGTPCDDGDACTSGDVCGEDGACAGTAFSCDDGIDCTIDACDGIGGCGYTVAAGWCLINAVCIEAGALRPGKPCQECLPSISLSEYSADDTNACEDGDQCVGAGTCQDGECTAGVPAECDDGIECTADTCTPEEGCTSEPVDALCDDDNDCTEDLCEETGCATEPVNCDDDDVCTTDSCDPAVGCVSDAIEGCGG